MPDPNEPTLHPDHENADHPPAAADPPPPAAHPDYPPEPKGYDPALEPVVLGPDYQDGAKEPDRPPRPDKTSPRYAGEGRPVEGQEARRAYGDIAAILGRNMDPRNKLDLIAERCQKALE